MTCLFLFHLYTNTRAFTTVHQVAKSLKPRHTVELEKGIVALRKSAAAKGIAQGKVVTKEDFDKHIKGVLEPITKNGGKFNVDVVSIHSPAGGVVILT